jgi:hypothetical protein
MHTNSVFDKFELVKNLAKSSRMSHRETPRSKTNRGVKIMQRIELPEMI